MIVLLFGLSYIERPILGDHPKAHISGFYVKFGGLHVKSGGFHKIRRISCENLRNQIIPEKLFSFMECSGKAMSHDFT